jgi:hypothetical protein
MDKGEKQELSFKGGAIKMKYSSRRTVVIIVEEVIAIIKHSGSIGTNWPTHFLE